MKHAVGTAQLTGALLLALTVTLAAACRSKPPGGPVADFRDFPLVVYQGAELLGGGEATFAKAFEQRQPVVLNFWAGECPPCRAEMPAFQRVADEYRGRVLFIGVDVGPFTGLGTSDDAQRLLAELGIRYSAAAAANAEPLRLYGVRSMPTTLFFEGNGRLVEQVPGLVLENRLRQNVERLASGAG